MAEVPPHDESTDGKHERPPAAHTAGGQFHRVDDAHRTTVMLLGSGEFSRELAIALQRLGAEVIAVERYADAPAQSRRA